MSSRDSQLEAKFSDKTVERSTDRGPVSTAVDGLRGMSRFLLMSSLLAISRPSPARASQVEAVSVNPAAGLHLHLGEYAYLHGGVHGELPAYRRSPSVLDQKLKLHFDAAFGFHIGKLLELGLLAHFELDGKELTPALGGELQLVLFHEGNFSVPLYTSAVFSVEGPVQLHAIEARLLADVGKFFAGVEGSYELGHHADDAPEVCAGLVVGGKLASWLTLRTGAQMCGEGGFGENLAVQVPVEFEVDLHVGGDHSDEDEHHGHH